MRTAFVNSKSHFRVAFAVLTSLLMACSTAPDSEENAIRTMCMEIAEHYPQATLQDVYKTCFQDFFGAEHLLKDTAMAHNYLLSEIAACKDENLSAMPDYEPTGFRHRFTRVNLSLIHAGQLSESELFSRFVDAAGQNNAYSDNWSEEWQRIEKIALEVHPAWTDTILQAALQFAASTASPVRHSEAFRNAYHPHYRIVRK
jgi:hypothetical protein